MTKEEIIRDYNYSDSVSYKEVLDIYNALIRDGKQSDAKRLIGEYGGIIQVIIKYNYQIRKI